MRAIFGEFIHLIANKIFILSHKYLYNNYYNNCINLKNYYIIMK